MGKRPILMISANDAATVSLPSKKRKFGKIGTANCERCTSRGLSSMKFGTSSKKMENRPRETMRTRRKEISFKVSRRTMKATKTSTHQESKALASGSSWTTDFANGGTAILPVFSGSPQALVVESQSCHEL